MVDEEARTVCEPVFRNADICFLPKRDAIAVMQIQAPNVDLLVLNRLKSSWNN